MKTKAASFTLHLPASVKAEAGLLAAEVGSSLNQFVATAVAEKVSALKAMRFFTQRRGNADWEAFDRFMNRKGGLKPAPDDEIPGEYRAARRKARSGSAATK